MPKLARAVLSALVMWSAIGALFALGKVVHDVAGNEGVVLLFLGILMFVWSVFAFYSSDLC